MEMKITIKDTNLKKLVDLNKRLGHKKLQDTVRFMIKTYKLE